MPIDCKNLKDLVQQVNTCTNKNQDFRLRLYSSYSKDKKMKRASLYAVNDDNERMTFAVTYRGKDIVDDTYEFSDFGGSEEMVQMLRQLLLVHRWNRSGLDMDKSTKI